MCKPLNMSSVHFALLTDVVLNVKVCSVKSLLSVSVMLNHKSSCCCYDGRGSSGLCVYTIFFDKIKGYILWKLSGLSLWRVGGETNHLHYILSVSIPLLLTLH